MDSSHGTSASTGSGSGRRTVDRESRVQAPDDDEEEFHSQVGEVCSGKRKLKWLQDILREAKLVAGPKKPVIKSTLPDRFYSYMEMVANIIDSKPSIYEEGASQ